MEKHYYIGEGPEAEKLIAATLEQSKVSEEARRALMADYGADGVIESRGFNNTVVGLGFKEKIDVPFLKGHELLSGGYAYYPKRNTKDGKELAKRLNDKRLSFDHSRFILDYLKANRTVIEGTKVIMSAACISEDMKKILVVIPGVAEKVPFSDPFPAVPEWLQEVKESEFLAAQGK